jgi:nucleoside-diphosphate-sugar epimerase
MRSPHSSEVRGRRTGTKAFFFLDAAAERHLLATERHDDSTSLNIGSGEKVGIRDLARMVASVVGFNGDIVWDTSKPRRHPQRRAPFRLLGDMLAARRFGAYARMVHGGT